MSTNPNTAHLAQFFPASTPDGQPFAPFPHQLDDLATLLQSDRYGLFWEMGLGKTAEIIAELNARLDVRRALIVTPLSVVGEFHRACEWMLSRADMKPFAARGSREQKERVFLEAARADAAVVITNHETLRHCTEVCVAFAPHYMVVDESHVIKEKSSWLWKAAMRVRERARYRRILSGTPVPKDQTDLWGQFAFLDERILGDNFYAFRARYAVMGGFKNKKVVAQRNVAELNQRLAPWASRRFKADCLNLPPKVYVKREVELSPEQKRCYRELREEAITYIGQHPVQVPTTVARYLRLSQLCGGFLMPDDAVPLVGLSRPAPEAFDPNPKLEALNEVVDDLPPDAKIIVFARFTAEVQAVVAALSKRMPAHEISGRVPQAKRDAARAVFNADPGPQAMVCQIKAGGTGLNLQAASVEIYFSNTYSWSDRAQSEDRAHRPGQTKTVTIVDLISTLDGRKTIDHTVLEALRKKKEVSDLILTDPAGTL